MHWKITSFIQDCFANKVKRRRSIAVLSVLSVLVIGVVALQLMQPAITMSSELICVLEEHSHTEDCYAVHLTCELAESEDHAHSDACYTRALVCGKDAHTHDGSCYAQVIEETVPPTEVPATEVPATDAPATDVPATDLPVTDVPVTDVPAADIPATDVPATGAPAVEPTATDAPATDIPATETPVETATPVPLSLAITSKKNLSIMIDETATWQLSAAGVEALSYTVTNAQSGTEVLPETNLNSDATSLSWTTSVPGIYHITVSATNGIDTVKDSASLAVSDGDLVLGLTTDALYASPSNSPIYNITCSGGVTPLKYQVTVFQDETEILSLTDFEENVFTVSVEPWEKKSTITVKVKAVDANGAEAETTATLRCSGTLVETPAEWRSAFSGIKLTGEWPKDILAIAETQLGYTESEDNFVIMDDGFYGYTRYGDWWHLPYSDWCAMFVSFCADNADLPKDIFPQESNATRMCRDYASIGLYAKADGDYIPVPGDLIFFDWDGDRIANHVGIVYSVSDSQVTAIEGNHDAKVGKHSYSLNDNMILGYGLINMAYESMLADNATTEPVVDPTPTPDGEASYYICGVSEHAHEAACYDEDGNLICTLSEHIHSDECLAVPENTEPIEATETPVPEATEPVVTPVPETTGGEETPVPETTEPAGTPAPEVVIECGLEEHTHSEACYDAEGSLICEATEHVHDENCLVEHVFYCGVEEHAHSEACYDAEGNLICEAEEHIHTEVCSKPQPTHYEYMDRYVYITVDIPEGVTLPFGTELVITPIDHYSAKYSNTVNQAKQVTGKTSLEDLVYDISFILNGEEVEPQGGSVNIRFQLASDVLNSKEMFPDEFDINVVHMLDDYTPELLDNYAEIDENGTVHSINFSSDSFSTYYVSVNLAGDIDPGTYAGKKFAYNDINNALVNSKNYDKYIVHTSPLGIAGSFHLVAFDTANLQAHTNGNILANTLYAASNFGTNQLADELSYVLNYKQINSGSGAKPGHVLVIGSGHTVELVDNGTAMSIDGKKIDRPYNIIKDRNSNTRPFVDLDYVEKQVRQINESLFKVTKNLSPDQIAVYSFWGGASSLDPGTKSFGVDAALKTNGGWYVSPNGGYYMNPTITVDKPDGAGYIEISPSTLNGISRRLELRGFKKNHNGSLIINVDCTGCSTINLPSTMLYVDDRQTAASETGEFSNGKVIWNFKNAEGCTINTDTMIGSIVAPGATVNIKSNLNGTVIADVINVKAESHRTDFTGTTRPATVKDSFKKQVDGKTPKADQNFLFIREEAELTGSNVSWVDPVEAMNYGSEFHFAETTYRESDVGTHWYRVYEDRSETNNPGNKYNLSKDLYLVKVSVTREMMHGPGMIGSGYFTMKVTPTYYRFENIENPAGASYDLPTHGEPKINNVQGKKVGAKDVVFKNETIPDGGVTPTPAVTTPDVPTATPTPNPQHAEISISLAKHVNGLPVVGNQTFQFVLEELTIDPNSGVVSTNLIDGAKTNVNAEIKFEHIQIAHNPAINGANDVTKDESRSHWFRIYEKPQQGEEINSNYDLSTVQYYARVDVFDDFTNGVTVENVTYYKSVLINFDGSPKMVSFVRENDGDGQLLYYTINTTEATEVSASEMIFNNNEKNRNPNPTQIGFDLRKQINGFSVISKENGEFPAFSFKLEELMQNEVANGDSITVTPEWVAIGTKTNAYDPNRMVESVNELYQRENQTAQQPAADITLDQPAMDLIHFDVEYKFQTDVGVHWYRVTELKNAPVKYLRNADNSVTESEEPFVFVTGENQQQPILTYSKEQYYIRVEVTMDEDYNLHTATTYYQYPFDNDENLKLVANGTEVDTEQMHEVTDPFNEHVFHNKLEQEPAAAVIDPGAVYKTFDSHTVGSDRDRDFTFTLEQLIGDSWTQIQTAHNTSKNNLKGIFSGVDIDNYGVVKFDDLTYTEPGIYWYRIRESQKTMPGVQLDTAEYIMKVEVKSELEEGADPIEFEGDPTKYKRYQTVQTFYKVNESAVYGTTSGTQPSGGGSSSTPSATPAPTAAPSNADLAGEYQSGQTKSVSVALPDDTSYYLLIVSDQTTADKFTCTLDSGIPHSAHRNSDGKLMYTFGQTESSDDAVITIQYTGSDTATINSIELYSYYSNPHPLVESWSWDGSSAPQNSSNNMVLLSAPLALSSGATINGGLAGTYNKGDTKTVYVELHDGPGNYCIGFGYQSVSQFSATIGGLPFGDWGKEFGKPLSAADGVDFSQAVPITLTYKAENNNGSDSVTLNSVKLYIQNHENTPIVEYVSGSSSGDNTAPPTPTTTPGSSVSTTTGVLNGGTLAGAYAPGAIKEVSITTATFMSEGQRPFELLLTIDGDPNSLDCKVNGEAPNAGCTLVGGNVYSFGKWQLNSNQNITLTVQNNGSSPINVTKAEFYRQDLYDNRVENPVDCGSMNVTGRIPLIVPVPNDTNGSYMVNPQALVGYDPLSGPGNEYPQAAYTEFTHRVFNNTTPHSGSSVDVTFKFFKTIEGYSDQTDKQFEFELYEKDDGPNWRKIQTSKNNITAESHDGDNKFPIEFDPIRYTSPGEHWYKVVETPIAVPGYTLDTTTYYIRVNVDRNGNGLDATIREYGVETSNGVHNIVIENQTSMNIQKVYRREDANSNNVVEGTGFIKFPAEVTAPNSCYVRLTLDSITGTVNTDITFQVNGYAVSNPYNIVEGALPQNYANQYMTVLPISGSNSIATDVWYPFTLRANNMQNCSSDASFALASLEYQAEPNGPWVRALFSDTGTDDGQTSSSSTSTGTTTYTSLFDEEGRPVEDALNAVSHNNNRTFHNERIPVIYNDISTELKLFKHVNNELHVNTNGETTFDLFHFTLQKLDGGTWTTVSPTEGTSIANNDNGEVIFNTANTGDSQSPLKYGSGDVGDHWYRVTENSDVSLSTKYIMSNEVYFFKTTVIKQGGELHANTITYTLPTGGTEAGVIAADNTIDESKLVEVANGQNIFHNKIITLLPDQTQIDIRFYKQIGSGIYTGDAKFDFALDEYTFDQDNYRLVRAATPTQTFQNDHQTAKIRLTYNVGQGQLGDGSASIVYYYKAYEKPSDDPNLISLYEFSKQAYLVKVELRRNENQLTAKAYYYNWPVAEEHPESGNPVAFNPAAYGEADALYTNTSENENKYSETSGTVPSFVNTSLNSRELPATGGAGTILFTAVGMLLIAATLLYWYVSRRKRERRYE